MKRTSILILTLIIILSMAAPVFATTGSAYSGIPTFSIVSVETDTSVTIKTYNFPANDTFTVTMGAYGTKGIGGIVVESTNSGSGGVFTKTYTIPNALKSSNRIAIRLQSSTSGYYAYNWFYNSTSPGVAPTPKPGSGYGGIPTFSIQSVERDVSVTIKTNNFPANDTFTVRMGAYGTKGVGGIVVDTTDSGTGGVFTKTYTIPDALKGSYRIAIRLESPTSGYYAYNWFFNNTTGTSTGPAPTPAPGTGYKGIPTFSISSVVRDQSVTIRTNNFPANDTFTVTMGAYGTKGIGGIVVDSTESGTGGVFTKTYTIPDALKGSQRIAIRLQSSISGYYAYNWFYNNTAP